MEGLTDRPAALRDLLRGYATLCPVRLLRFPSHLDFGIVHDSLLHDLLNEPFASYPPAAEYQARFWKWALDNLQRMDCPEDAEIDAQLYEHYVSLMHSPALPQAVGVQPPTPSFMTYFWKNGFTYRNATLLESRTTIESGTTGLRTWLASLVLAQFLVTNPDLVQCNRVLELGSGVGFLGIMIATLQLSCGRAGGALTLTDVNDEVLAICTKNLNLPCNLSSTHSALSCIPLDWADALDELRSPAMHSSFQRSRPDLIVGADVVYDPSIILPLVKTIQIGMFENPKCTALIALTERNKDTLDQFVSTAAQHLQVEEVQHQLQSLHEFWGVADEAFVDNAQSQTVRIFRITKRAEASTVATAT